MEISEGRKIKEEQIKNKAQLTAILNILDKYDNCTLLELAQQIDSLYHPEKQVVCPKPEMKFTGNYTCVCGESFRGYETDKYVAHTKQCKQFQEEKLSAVPSTPAKERLIRCPFCDKDFFLDQVKFVSTPASEVKMMGINKRVKVISCESKLSEKWIGMEGTITEENKIQCFVFFSDGQVHWFWKDELELVTPASEGMLLTDEEIVDFTEDYQEQVYKEFDDILNQLKFLGDLCGKQLLKATPLIEARCFEKCIPVPQPETPDELKPKIVCLCGSTRFSEAFQKAQFDLTMAGEIVLTIGCNMKTDTELFKDYSESELKEIKTKLDELHKRKIDLADEVLILNVGNYIGESTASEMSYAYAHNKPVRFLNPSKALDFNWNHIENRIWKDTKGGIY